MDDLISREQALDAIHDWKPSDVFDEFNPTTAFTIIYALPSAQVDLSGFCDRLWRSAYDRGYERCRQDAIDAILNLTSMESVDELREYAHRLTAQSWSYGVLESIDAVAYLPSAQPERKKGEWIDQDDGAYYPVECSECRKIPLFDVDGDYVLSNFCPNCGADMRGADE